MAGLLWQVAGISLTQFVASFSSYAAIYSSFAILGPLPDLAAGGGWLIVLVGAEVVIQPSASRCLSQERLPRRHSQLFQEQLALWPRSVELTRGPLAAGRSWTRLGWLPPSGCLSQPWKS